jgi:RNA polymerase sigma-70 factor (ECF subfamily)
VRGDDRAFTLLVERHHAKVFRLVRGIVGDWHQSEDVCQEVFTTLYKKIRDFRHDSRLSTWIYRVAVNASLKARKRRRNRGLDSLETEAIAEAQRAAAPGDAAQPFEGDEVFRKLLAPLPEKLRAAVVLREEGGLSYDEIADALHCSRGAVEQRLHRAMVLLREIWKEKHDWLERR